MKLLSIEALHTLRLAIFDNAERLHKEAKLLFDHKMYSRAYLLAYFCFEELGKISMIVGAIAKLKSGETVDWKKLEKRFFSHTEKIASQNYHYYMFGLEPDLFRDSDLKWLEQAQASVNQSFKKKNLATYVEVKEKEFLLPHEQISKIECKELIDLTFECLRAHWLSEKFSNPVLKGKQTT